MRDRDLIEALRKQSEAVGDLEMFIAGLTEKLRHARNNLNLAIASQNLPFSVKMAKEARAEIEDILDQMEKTK